jgi:hypothetical protein
VWHVRHARRHHHHHLLLLLAELALELLLHVLELKATVLGEERMLVHVVTCKQRRSSDLQTKTKL